VIEAVPADRDILFLPDMFLGAYLERVTGRKMKIWPGECHVHAGIRTDDVSRMLDERPGADLLIHPECGCASQCMYAAAQDAALARRTHVFSTEGMVNHVARSPNRDFVVATETGILHRLTRESPDKRFYAMSERAVCRYMKMITLEKLRDSLRDMRHVVTVDDDVAARARGAITRMVEIA
jgi:quinolinate synthase